MGGSRGAAGSPGGAGRPGYANSSTRRSRQPSAAPAAPAQDDMLTQLQKLGELKAAGVLTEEEFAAQKAKILAG